MTNSTGSRREEGRTQQMHAGLWASGMLSEHELCLLRYTRFGSASTCK